MILCISGFWTIRDQTVISGSGNAQFITNTKLKSSKPTQLTAQTFLWFSNSSFKMDTLSLPEHNTDSISVKIGLLIQLCDLAGRMRLDWWGILRTRLFLVALQWIRFAGSECIPMTVLLFPFFKTKLIKMCFINFYYQAILINTVKWCTLSPRISGITVWITLCKPRNAAVWFEHPDLIKAISKNTSCILNDLCITNTNTDHVLICF